MMRRRVPETGAWRFEVGSDPGYERFRAVKAEDGRLPAPSFPAAAHYGAKPAPLHKPKHWTKRPFCPTLLLRTVTLSSEETPPMPFFIFLSHSSPDRNWVEYLKQQAESIGIQVYLYEHDPQPGVYISDKVQQQISASDAVVVLLTQHSQFSPYVQQEIGFAAARQRLIIPLVQPGTDPRCLAMLNGKEYIPFDFNNPQVALVALQSFLTYLSRLSGFKDEQIRATQQQANATAVLLGFCALVVVALRADNDEPPPSHPRRR
jgi:TIR domain